MEILEKDGFMLKKNNWLIDNEKNYALNYKLSISLQKKVD